MLALAILMILFGWLFLYSGITNRSVKDQILGAFGR